MDTFKSQQGEDFLNDLTHPNVSKSQSVNLIAHRRRPVAAWTALRKWDLERPQLQLKLVLFWSTPNEIYHSLTPLSLTNKTDSLPFRVAYVEYSSLAIKDQNLGSTLELVSSLVYTPPDD